MSWPSVPAGELMVKRGGSVNPSKFPDETFELLSIPAFDINQPEILQGSEIGSSKSCIAPGDILLSKIVPHIRRCWVVPKRGKHRQIGSGEWIIFRDDRFDAGFLKHFLTSDGFHSHFMNTVAGVGGSLVRARPAEVANIQIPLPPLEEQKRIAAILDKADAIRRKRQQAIQLADDFLRAVFLDMFGDPVANPKGWEVKCLSEVARIQIGPFGTQLHKEDYIEGGIPLINPTHIVDGKIVPDMFLTISEEKYHSLPEYHLKVDDIIMGRRGAMGRCAIVGDTEKNYICGTGSLIIQPFVKGAFSIYLFKLLSSTAIKEYLESESIGATLPNLNKGIVGGIQVPVPDKEALNKFEKVLLGIRDSSLKNNLFNEQPFSDSLSQKAFSGEL